MASATVVTTSVSELAAFIRRHPRLLVITGAGVSTASGIPDYRDHDGQWKQSQPVTWQAFVGSEYARQRYWARSMLGWPRFGQARPNGAHGALVQLEAAGHVSALITQNVDGLHQRAGHHHVIDLHGRLDRVDCLACGCRLTRADVQRQLLTINPEFADRPATLLADGDVALETADFSQFRLPTCPRCGGLVKPAVVFFGETVPPARVAMALAALEQADAVLVVGSSLMVYSGFRFCRAAAAQGKPIAALNLGRTRADDLLALKVSQSCAEALPELIGQLAI